MNLHLLAREIMKGNGRLQVTGQMDHDMVVAFSQGKPEIRRWFYQDEWMVGPREYAIKKGESQSDWKGRMEALMKKNGVNSLPLPGWKPRWEDPKSEDSQAWRKLIKETDGQALIMPPYWNGNWMYGEYQKWISLERESDGPMTWVLCPYQRGTETAKMEVTADQVVVSKGSESDSLTFDSAGKIILTRNGQETILRK